MAIFYQKEACQSKGSFFQPPKAKEENCKLYFFFQLQMQCHECNFHARGFLFIVEERGVVDVETTMGDSCWALVRQSAF